MNPDFTSSKARVDSCCGGARAGDERKEFRSALALHRTTRYYTLATVQRLSQRQLDFKPAADKWSVGEVSDHLVLGHRLNLSYMAEVIGLKKAGQRPVLRLNFTDVDVSVAYLPKAVLPAFAVPFKVMNICLPSIVRDFLTRYSLVPAQNAQITTPRRGRTADELCQDLISSMKETEMLLESHQHLDYCEMVVEHPLLGSNTLPGLLRFLALHEQRHQSQIEGVLRSAGFPN